MSACLGGWRSTLPTTRLRLSPRKGFWILEALGGGSPGEVIHVAQMPNKAELTDPLPPRIRKLNDD